jgi:hypothetical protein
MGKLGESEQALFVVFLDCLFTEATQKAEVVFAYGLGATAILKFAYAAVIVHQ